MNVDIQTPRSDQSKAPERRRPVGATRVVFGSLVAGAMTALALALAVFPGATEGVITGSLLLGFGVGWALMAVLSSRITTQPQRWPAVPAAAMTSAGLGLIVFAPDDSTLRALAWVWPPALLALVAWMFVQMRRELPRGGRWLLTPVLVVLAVCSVGAVAQNVSTTSIEGEFPAPGKTYAVGDHRLHLDCRGEGGPTVVLFNGLGEISASWGWIVQGMGSTTRVCAYDRAGQAWSDDVSEPQDGVTAARDLHALLEQAGEQGPYVLVGHSIGGTYAMTYAAQYPEQVAGMVLLDSSSPRQLTEIPAYPMQYALMRRGLALLPTLARVGVGHLISPAPDLPGEAAERVAAMTSTTRAFRNGRDDLATIPTLFEQAQALTTLHDLPLAVLTASESLGDEGWRAEQDRMAALSTNHVHRVIESSHDGLVSGEEPAAESLRAIVEVVAAARSNSPLAAD
jgi:pimeloyl-ACP methyl ester carboxylesterase